VVPTRPGDEATALGDLLGHADHGIDQHAVILVGERLATVPGALSAAVDLARKSGARLAWVPRRAGDRGALEAGCLPGLLPGGRPLADAGARVDVATAWGVDALPEAPGRDADAIVRALGAGELRGLVIGGVDPDDTADPSATRKAIVAARFVVALDLRETEVTRAADVVFPVAAPVEKAGTYVTWEGRPRPFEAVITGTNALPDLRVLVGIAEELGRPLGFRTVADVRAEMTEMGPWDGHRPALATVPSQPAPEGLALATWKQMLDNGRMQDGEQHLRATARAAVVRLSPAHAEQHGPTVTVTGDRGSVTLPVEVVADMADDTVWLPANSVGRGVLAGLASPGSPVTISGGTQ
jgi:NADH-quinone oxidoreductase subunit G